jgi:hypothetical protein
MDPDEGHTMTDDIRFFEPTGTTVFRVTFSAAC